MIFYIFVSVCLPYLAPDLLRDWAGGYITRIDTEDAETAIFLVAFFLIFASLPDSEHLPINKFRTQYFLGPDRELSRRFSVLSLLCVALFLSLTTYSQGLSDMIDANFRRVIQDNSAVSFGFIPFLMGSTLSVFAYRFRTGFSILILVNISIFLSLSFMTGGRNIFILYIISLFYSDFLRMKPGAFAATSIIAILGMMLASSTMIDLRRSAQGTSAKYNDSILESATTGLIVIDQITLAVEFERQAEPDFFDVYGPVLAMPIPRAVWPDKPIQISRELRKYRFGDDSGGVPAGVVGESYLAGGWFVVALVGLAFGVFLAGIDRISRLAFSQRFPAAEAIGGVLAPSAAFVLFRGGLDIGMVRIGVIISTCLIALLLIRSRRERLLSAQEASARRAELKRSGAPSGKRPTGA